MKEYRGGGKLPVMRETDHELPRALAGIERAPAEPDALNLIEDRPHARRDVGPGVAPEGVP